MDRVSLSVNRSIDASPYPGIPAPPVVVAYLEIVARHENN